MIFNEDCLETMRNLDPGSIDLVVTSPPYDNLRHYKGYTFDFEKVANSLYRVIKKGGVVVWVVSDSTINGSETGTSFKQALKFIELGFNLHDTMIYLKNQLAYPDKNRYYNGFEYMFIFSKGRPKTFNAIKDRINSSVGRKVSGKSRNKNGEFTTMSCSGNKRKELGQRYNYWLMYNQSRGLHSKHPATFPLSLARDHIISWSNENETVYDPFMGSGTTAIACKELKRNFIGSEISKEYFEICNERLLNTKF